MPDAPRKNINEFLAWLEDQQKQLKELNDMMPDGNKFHLYFRGVSDSSYKNIPSIYRDGLVKNEDVIFKECLCRNSDDFVKDKSTFDKLVKMQHYGIPTRLLDITTNPLVALYFACRKSSIKPSNNGAIFAFFVSEKAIKYSDSDTVSAVANLALRPYGQMTTLGANRQYHAWISSLKTEDLQKQDQAYKNYRSKFNEHNAISYLLHDILGEKPYFQGIIEPEHLESIWCVRPKLNNNRIIRQDGAFLLFGILVDKKIPLSIPSVTLGKNYLVSCNTLFSILQNYGPNNSYISDVDFQKIKECFSATKLHSDDIEKLLQVINKYDNKRKNIPFILSKIKFFFLHNNTFLQDDLNTFRLFYDVLSTNNDDSHESCIQITNNKLFLNCLLKYNPILLCDGVEISNKKHFSIKLEAFAITEDKLFPELDRVAIFLKDKYKKNKEDCDESDHGKSV